MDGTASTDGQSNIVIFGNSQGAYHQPSGTNYSTLGGSSAIRRDSSIDTFYDPFVWYLRGYNNTEWVAVTQYAAIAKGGCLITGYSAEPVDPKKEILVVDYTCTPLPGKQYVAASPYMIQHDEGSGWPVIYQDITGETHIGMQGLMGPVPVSKGKYPAGTGWKLIASSADHALALRNDGTVTGWGDNTYGQLDLPTGVTYTDIAAGRYFSIGLSTDGTIYAVGDDGNKQVSGKPEHSGYLSVVANNETAAALSHDGYIYVWGKPIPGVLSTSVDGGYTDIALGPDYLIAIKEPAPELHLTGPLSPGKPVSCRESNQYSEEELMIPYGSTIEHTINDVTRIIRPDGTEVGWVNDAKAPRVLVPSGKTLPSSHTYDIPDGSFIQTLDPKTTHVSLSNIRLLTDVSLTTQNNPTIQMETQKNGNIHSGWIEDSKAENKANLGQFIAEWKVPSSPPNSTTTSVNYIFNGIQNHAGSTISIVQPVLEYNLATHAWTGAAWYTHGQVGYRAGHWDTKVGNNTEGTLAWNSKKKQWQIIYKDLGSSQTSSNFSVESPEIGSTNLDAFCALEGWYIIDDKDVSGKITFKNIKLKDNDLVDVTPSWAKETHPSEMGLTNLDVTWTPDEKEVTLQTKNA
jgi:hypothetical protein